MSVLRIRLKNCIQTILDLEPAMRKNGESGFDEDFSRLKSFLNHIDEMELGEDDVSRLETAASSFLKELSRSSYIFEPCKRIVQ
ncbi:MAG: hypothetical protein K2H64_02785 [Desulfovibrio sp.]|nr:hypothetical protein [Desulfovibrio sp.]